MIETLIRAYLDRTESDSSLWIDAWFEGRAVARLDGGFDSPIVVGEMPADVVSVIDSRRTSTSGARRLTSLRISYFRGFREFSQPIDLAADLVVVDGPNSAGKTSLAEAIEWLFTGQLVRRELRELGNPRELEACVANVFRPEGQETWVEGRLELVDGRNVVLRRELVEDYGPASTMACRSAAYVDGGRLSADEEDAFLLACFAGVPPILMQHTLRLFVFSAPAERRRYFERLLQLDSLTELIEKAVVTKAKLPQFASGKYKSAAETWSRVRNSVGQKSQAAIRAVEKAAPDALQDVIEKQLMAIATIEFGDQLPRNESLTDARNEVDKLQSHARLQTFPVLDRLRPIRVVDQNFDTELSAVALSNTHEALLAAETTLESAQGAVDSITSAQLAVAKATATLVDAGLLEPDVQLSQVCPICEHTPASITHARLTAIGQIIPAEKALDLAVRRVNALRQDLAGRVRKLQAILGNVLPVQPNDVEWSEALVSVGEDTRASTTALRRFADEDDTATPLRSALGLLLVALNRNDPAASLGRQVDFVTKLALRLPDVATRYASLVKDIETAVGAGAKADPAYSRRETWLLAASDTTGLVGALRWERAKRDVQSALETARDALISVRQDILEARRTGFNAALNEFWSILRRDRYSAFSQLAIPAPTGKGFPIEIQVKARLDNATSVREVDALRVLSESQIHVIGIAAFITRASLLHQQFLVFDDPVQSMDEAHFRTFAGLLLTHLLNAGFQVIVLTHNETFARDVADAQTDRATYASLRMRLSRKKGCVLEEGSRRLSSRLKRIRRALEDGELDEGWRWVRLAIERLYLAIRIKHGEKGFDSATWRGHTAEAMWNEGVSDIVQQTDAELPACLKDMLSLSVAGAHDAASRGATDLENALDEIRRISGLFGILE